MKFKGWRGKLPSLSWVTPPVTSGGSSWPGLYSMGTIMWASAAVKDPEKCSPPNWDAVNKEGRDGYWAFGLNTLTF